MSWIPPAEGVMLSGKVVIPTPPTGHAIEGTITKTWMQDRERELLQRERNQLYRIIWPREPLRIIAVGWSESYPIQ